MGVPYDSMPLMVVEGPVDEEEPEVCAGARMGAVEECLPVVQGGMVRNSSKVRTRGLQHCQPGGGLDGVGGGGWEGGCLFGLRGRWARRGGSGSPPQGL